MRVLVALLLNLLLLIKALVALPFRLMARRRRAPYVRFALRGDPPYRDLARRRWRIFSKRDPAEVRSLDELRRQLSALAKDRRVIGAVFFVEHLRLTQAKADAIAALLSELRAAGKEAIGYALHAGNGEYEVLCAADRIILSPPGRLDLTGFAAEPVAIKAALDRAGIGAQFVRRGEYKTAPELFTDPQISPVHRRTVEHLLDLRFQDLLLRISRGRRISLDEAKRKVDGGPYSARRAQAEGLCDGLCNALDLASFLSPREEKAAAEGSKESAPKRSVEGSAEKSAEGSKEGSPQKSEEELPDWDDYQSALPWPAIAWRRLKRRPRLSLVPLQGLIAEGEGGRAPVGPEIAGSESVVAAVRSARRDRRTAAILLYVNSPGGSALASELVLDEVRRASKKKPVVAYFDRVAASGGYMAALGATEIWAAPGAIAGSIGVFGGKFELSGLFERLGIHRTVLTRGEHAGMSTLSRPFTPKEREAIELEIEEAYQDFLEQVAGARGKSKEEIHARAEGRIYSGDEALGAGLIDRTGSFEDACRRALELAKAPAGRFEVLIHRAPRRRIPILRLMGEAQKTGVFALWLPGLDWLAGADHDGIEAGGR